MVRLTKRNMMAFIQKAVFMLVLFSLSFLMGCIDDDPDPSSLLLSNNIPVADAGPDQNILENGVTVQLDGSNSSDPEGDPISYQWIILESPRGSSAPLNDNTTESPNFFADVDGTYRVELVVIEVPEIDTTAQVDVPFSDQGQRSEPDEVVITVGAPGPFTESGNKLMLDGSHFARSAISMAFGGTMDLTAEGWFNLTSLPTTGNEAFLFGKKGVFEVVVTPALDVQGRLYPASGATKVLTAVSKVALTEWHHIALFLDRSSKQTYIALDGIISTPEAPPGELAQNVNRFTMGSPDGLNLWVGMADEVRVTQDVRYRASATAAAANFDPPLELLIPDSPFIDGARNTVHVLYHFDAVAGSFRFSDFSLRLNDLFLVGLTGFQPFGRMLTGRQNHTATGSSQISSERTITWQTDNPSNSQLEYGTSTSLGTFSALLDSAPNEVTSHSITIDLATAFPSLVIDKDTTIYYRVSSKNSANPVTISPIAPAVFSFKPADTVGPVISTPSSGIPTSTGTTITWTTDEGATSKIDYGRSGNFGSVSENLASFTTSHSHALTGLTQSAIYFYRVINVDTSGNASISSIGTFTTVADGDTTPPVITVDPALTATHITDVSIGWTTDGNATAQVEYGLDTTYGSFSTLDSSPDATVQGRSIEGLSPGTLYSYRVISADDKGNTVTSDNFTFTTLAATSAADSTAPVITIAPLATASKATTSEMTITWKTDEAVTSRVEYKLNSDISYTSSPVSTTLTTSQSHTLSNLATGTLYDYRVVSLDAVVPTPNQDLTSGLTFTTPSTLAAPVISSVSAVKDQRIWISGGIDNGGNPIEQSETINQNGEVSSDASVSVTVIGSVIGEAVGVGDGINTNFSLALQFKNIEESSLTVSGGGVTATDNGAGVLTGTGVASGSTVDYEAGVVTLIYDSAPGINISITSNYDYDKGSSGLFNHTATRLPDGRVLIAGGENSDRDPLNNVFVFTPDPNRAGEGTVASIVPLNEARRFHTSSLREDGSVIIALGEDETNTGLPSTLNTFEVLEEVSGTFFHMTPPTNHTIPSKLHRAIYPKECDEDSSQIDLLIVGGFDAGNVPTVGSPAMLTARVRHAITCLSNGTILVTGGISDTGFILNTAEVYDPSSGIYTALGETMDTPRADHTATLLPDNTVLIAGGFNQFGQALLSAEIYDLSTNKFTLLETTSMSQGRFGHRALLWTDFITGNRGVLIIGGADNGGAPIDLLEIYFP